MAKDIQSLIRPGMGMKILDSVGEFDFDFWNGRLLCWEPPMQGETYTLGIDPAEGVGADRSVCEVIKVGNLHHPDVQVAEFCSDFIDPVDFASIVKAIGHFYCEDDRTEAFAIIETNAPCGDTIVNELRSRHEYTNLYIRKEYEKVTNIYTNKLGWWTNRVSRPKIIARGLHAFSNHDLILNSPFLLDEMADFERDHFIAKAKARHGKHDDRIMALLIGYWGAHDEEWLSGEDIAEERRLRDKAGILQAQMTTTNPAHKRPDFQSSAMSARDMWSAADDFLFGDM